MPTVLPVTELQRNTATLTDEAMRTKEPIYLTRRGKAAVVLLDAAEYDREMNYRRAIVEREESVRAGISRGMMSLSAAIPYLLVSRLASLRTSGPCDVFRAVW